MVTSSYVNVPATERPAPIYTFFATPRPPSTINAPEVDDVESVVASTLTAPLNVPVVPDTAALNVPVVPDTAPLKVPVVPDTAPLKVPVVPLRPEGKFGAPLPALLLK